MKENFAEREKVAILRKRNLIFNSKNATPIGKFYSLNTTF